VGETRWEREGGREERREGGREGGRAGKRMRRNARCDGHHSDASLPSLLSWFLGATVISLDVVY
jgi:hypothetical protein